MHRILTKLQPTFFHHLDTGVNKLSHGTRNALNMVVFKSPTDNLSNDTPYAYSTDRIIIFIFHPLDTGVNKLSRGTRKAQNTVAFNSPTDKLSNDTPFAYIISQIKIHVFCDFAIFLRFWAWPTCATFGIVIFKVFYYTFPM